MKPGKGYNDFLLVIIHIILSKAWNILHTPPGYHPRGGPLNKNKYYIVPTVTKNSWKKNKKGHSNF